jgi:transposase
MLRPEPKNSVPEETQRVARAAFPKGNGYMTMRDELGSIYEDAEFAELFPAKGQPAESPGCLAVATILQFAEGLSDRQAADAVRSRIDWKYLLGLELGDAGFDYSVLSEFRKRLLAGKKEQALLDVLLAKFQARGLLKKGGRQRTDSTHVEAAIRRLNRLERVGESLRQALNSLAVVAPTWLKAQIPVAWYQRYATRFEAYRLPTAESEREALAVQIGQDGRDLLEWVYAENAPAVLQTLEAVHTLQWVWIQEYYQQGRQLTWRTWDNLPPSERQIATPYDPEARYSEKRETKWVGYKGHLTEGCEEDQPHFITQVETTPATLPDNQVTETIHQHLAAKGLLPSEHLLDAGYVDALLLTTSQKQYGVRLVGPALSGASWQAKAGQGFDLAHFTIDWVSQQVLCPRQQLSRAWYETLDASGNPCIQVEFARAVCQACSARQQCTRAKRTGRRLLFRPRAEYEALLTLRQFQQTEEFQVIYAKRAGIEGTLSQAVRRCDFRRARYLGLAKTHLQHLLTAIAINLIRFSNWIRKYPLASTRTSPLLALAPA